MSEHVFKNTDFIFIYFFYWGGGGAFVHIFVKLIEDSLSDSLFTPQKKIFACITNKIDFTRQSDYTLNWHSNFSTKSQRFSFFK